MTKVNGAVGGAFVIAVVLFYVTVQIAMHVLEPEFNPLRVPMSAYVLGAYGAWMTATYFVLAAGLLALAYCLATTLRRRPLTATAVIFLVIAASGALLAGSFPMDLPGGTLTSAGRLHMVGGALTFPSWILGVLLFTLSIRQDPRWQAVSAPLTVVAAGVVVAGAIMFLSVAILGFGAYAQRLLVVLLFAWMVLAALRVIRLSRVGSDAEQAGLHAEA